MSESDPKHDIEFTGERLIPGKVDRALLAEHVARYDLALRHAENAVALDAACGAGYGCAMLATKAKHVTGIDIDEKAIEYAKTHYSSDNIEYKTCSVLALPFDDDSFELITAFEIFEHIQNPEKMISELGRVAKSNALIMISTPNADYLRSSVENPFHVVEYNFDDFQQIIKNSFKGKINFLGQKRKNRRDAFLKPYILLKRFLKIPPILQKHPDKTSLTHEFLKMRSDYEFVETKIKEAEYFIALLHIE